ncbi:MAG TPA: ATP-binding protein [Nocardioidaceae bacterium]|nr:ATP-binding protein [Nocardioidaceae bacterium]
MSASAPMQPLRVEQVVTYLRVFGLVAGLPAILLASFPTAARLQVAWGTHLVLLLGTVALALWRHHVRPGDEKALLVAGFVLNSLVIAGYVVAFTHLQPNVAWAMVFTLLADAALRFGVRGAVTGTVLAALLFLVQTQAHEAATGVATPPAAYVFVLGTLAGAGGILAVFTLTLERQARMAQQQALALADASRVRDRMLAMSSHEFRGPLAAMMLASETVRANLERLGPERSAALLGEVDRHGRNLGRLVDDLVMVAQARSEAIEVRPRWDDLQASVQVALAAAGRHRDGHLLTVSVEPLSGELDHERFQQIVRNLVENAFKYSPPGSRVVVLLAARRDGRLELRVGDDGPGIPTADRERVFEPFGRRRGGKEHSDSSGLGLYVVQQIVAAMGGSLDLHTSSAGTEFVVLLPAQVSDALQAVPDKSDSGGPPHNGGADPERSGATGAVRR